MPPEGMTRTHSFQKPPIDLSDLARERRSTDLNAGDEPRFWRRIAPQIEGVLMRRTSIVAVPFVVLLAACAAESAPDDALATDQALDNCLEENVASVGGVHPLQRPKCPIPDPPRPLPVDTDGDTVLDINDHCPLVFGPVSNRGCPVPPP